MGGLMSVRRQVCRIAAFLASLAMFAACGGDEPTAVVGPDASGGSLTIFLGTTLEVTLGTVGPGSYAEQPDVTGVALEFIDVAIIPPFTPGGVRQRFRFGATSRGTARITIPKTSNAIDSSSYVLDVVVR
jgi:hypothetical protein